MPFYLTNYDDPIGLCMYCSKKVDGPGTWRNCWKARAFSHMKEFPKSFPGICPGFDGDMGYVNWNLKMVTLEDFDKFGNEGFKMAPRLEVNIRPCSDPEAERARIMEWMRARCSNPKHINTL